MWPRWLRRVATTSETRRSRLSPRARLIAVIVGILAAAGLMVALNWETVSTTPASVLSAEGRPDSRDLTLYFGSCLLDYTVSVEETDDEVRVLILLDSARVNACPDIAAIEEVVLEQPLGDRVLIDASRDAAVPVNEPLPR